MDNLKIRGLEDQDTDYILASWLRHYHNNSYFCKKIKKDVYYPRHEKIIKRILAHPATEVHVACNKDIPEVILSYLVLERAEKPTLHFTYTKDAFRNIGLANELVKFAKIDPNQCYFTHWTYTFDDLVHKYPGIIYDPYRI